MSERRMTTVATTLTTLAWFLGTQQAQTANRNRAGGRTIAVIVGHDTHMGLRSNGVDQNLGGCVNPFQRVGWQEFGQAVVQFVRGLDATRCEKTSQ